MKARGGAMERELAPQKGTQRCAVATVPPNTLRLSPSTAIVMATIPLDHDTTSQQRTIMDLQWIAIYLYTLGRVFGGPLMSSLLPLEGRAWHRNEIPWVHGPQCAANETVIRYPRAFVRLHGLPCLGRSRCRHELPWSSMTAVTKSCH